MGEDQPMTDGDPDLAALLRKLDEAGLERPVGYRHDLTRARFEALAARLEGDFGVGCYVDRHVQDASLHGRIEVPAGLLEGSAKLVVSVSNFGWMAVVSAENPGVYLDLAEAVADGAVSSDDLRTAVQALESLDYIVVPEELLTEPYDGIAPLAAHYPPKHPPDWWIRFFDYL
jgi:hypothetical protein